ncbi:MAG: DUF6057 family protein [Bacteroidales bacterium]|nr:DUF6057 family protein [Bacteroidales bacterium]
MPKSKKHNIAKAILGAMAAYAAIVLVLAWQLPDWIGFSEQWRTFYWDWAWVSENAHENGWLQVVSDFFVQFLANKWSAALLYALPCLLIWIALSAILKRWLKGWVLRIAPIAIMLAGAWIFLCNGLQNIDSNQRFKGQMCLVGKANWQEIIKQSQGRTISNHLELNMLNLALAETGNLKDHLKDQPSQDVNALFVLKIESPYVSALLSDVYWSAGEISMSQYYAFEANEKMDNLSPRLLKRLALTNIAFGHYAVAEKYLKWLDKTLFYSDWSQKCRALLNDKAVEADPVLKLKRKCIPEENCFPSVSSIVYDLQKIVAKNPEHTTSQQYLDALSQLYNIVSE